MPTSLGSQPERPHPRAPRPTRSAFADSSRPWPLAQGVVGRRVHSVDPSAGAVSSCPRLTSVVCGEYTRKLMLVKAFSPVTGLPPLVCKSIAIASRRTCGRGLGVNGQTSSILPCWSADSATAKLQTGVCHQPNCSSTPAALVEAILRPMYTFCVSEGWACPSWSAMARADNPASSSRVAVVLRKT